MRRQGVKRRSARGSIDTVPATALLVGPSGDPLLVGPGGDYLLVGPA